MTDTRPRLTGKQQAVLLCIAGYMDLRGYPPTIREVAESVGLSSTSSVSHQLRALEAKGYIRRPHGHARAIEVLPPVDGAW